MEVHDGGSRLSRSWFIDYTTVDNKSYGDIEETDLI